MKTAIILFNLGGPDKQEAVKPFLFNLFHDPAIIRVPQPLRYLLAKLISGKRAPIAREIYQKMGGGSPILPNTKAQADALEKTLSDLGDVRCFIVMRYWHPFADDAARDVKAYDPDRIVLLPLYPHFSTTTTGSSLKDWKKAASRIGLDKPTHTLCCYPEEDGFISAMATSIRQAYAEASQHGKPRLLLSAHGLPEKIVKAGDPYQWQCQQTAKAIIDKLAIPELDAVLCFQSRVGPLKWITPATDVEVHRAAEDKVPLIIAPIAFVSDHSETLVEINMEYRHLAMEKGVPHFVYVPPVGTAPDFINGLATMVRDILKDKTALRSNTGPRLCPKDFKDCCQGAA